MKSAVQIRNKRILTGLLALAVALVCACGKKEETTEKTKKERKTTVSSEVDEPAESQTPTSVSEETQTSSPTPSPSPAPDVSPTPSPDPSSFRTDKALNYMNSVTFDGVVLVADHGQEVWHIESGMADREQNILNSIDTVFEFGSITKQFTAVAIMQLVEQGKLSTDDTLDKYIPEYSHAGEVTIHQLLNMTSGVPDYLYCGVLGFTMEDLENLDFSTVMSFADMLGTVVTTPLEKEELVSKMCAYDLNFTPGTQFEYSNTNYYFLGIIIEQLSGLPYDEYIRKNILEPLNITELYPDTDHLTSNGRTDLGMIRFDLPHQDASISYAVGVMTGTAAGLLQWEYCVIDHALLTEESWAKIFDGGQFGYGYGWYICDGYVEHSGMTLGYNTNVRVDASNRRVVIALSNIQPLTGTDSRPMASDVSEELWKDF